MSSSCEIAWDLTIETLADVVAGSDVYLDERMRKIAAALTCRTQLAAASVLTGMGAELNWPMLDKYSELDLPAVARSVRGQSLGTKLVSDMEQRLIERGVRV